MEVRINDKVIQLKGYHSGNKYCIVQSSIDLHPSLSSKEKESLKERLQLDEYIMLV